MAVWLLFCVEKCVVLQKSSEPEDPNKQNVFESSEEIKVPHQKLPQRGGGNQTTGKKPESTTEKAKPYKKLPQTGDSSDAYGKWLTTLGVGLLLIARILYIRRK